MLFWSSAALPMYWVTSWNKPSRSPFEVISIKAVKICHFSSTKKLSEKSNFFLICFHLEWLITFLEQQRNFLFFFNFFLNFCKLSYGNETKNCISSLCIPSLSIFSVFLSYKWKINICSIFTWFKYKFFPYWLSFNFSRYFAWDNIIFSHFFACFVFLIRRIKLLLWGKFRQLEKLQGQNPSQLYS